MRKRTRYLLVILLFGVAGVVWWNGGIVGWLPVDLQYAHLSLLDRQYRQASDDPSALDKLWLNARKRRTEDAYRAFLQRHPDHVMALVAYGNFLADDDRYEEGARQWDTALAVDPSSAVTHNNLGQYCQHRGRIAEAIAHYERAIELDPNGAVYLYNWATACSTYRRDAQQKYGWSTDEVMSRCLAAYRKARDLDPRDFVYSNAYAEMFYFIPKADWQETYAALQFCLGQPLETAEREQTYGRLARVCMHLGRFDESTTWLAKMNSAEALPFRHALEKKQAALLSGIPDDAVALKMMRAVSDKP